MAPRIVHADVVLNRTFLPIIVSINDDMTYAEVADRMMAAATTAVVAAAADLVNDIHVKMELPG
jgi:hypothetical protein